MGGKFGDRAGRAELWPPLKLCAPRREITLSHGYSEHAWWSV